MYAKITELAAHLTLKDIDKHDVYHSLDQSVRSLTAHMREFVHPTGVVIILHHTELQEEQIRERQILALRIIDKRLHEIE